MIENLDLHNDLPALQDKLGWDAELARISHRLQNAPAPHVLGIHGDWGSGKTSFMRQLQLGLGGEMPGDASVEACEVQSLRKEEKKQLQKKIVTIWFDAWRYQNEASPVVALLQEMRTQMSVLPALQEKFKKVGTIALYSLLDSLSDVGKVIGYEGLPNAEKIEKRGEKWEKEHLSETLTTNSIREHLQKTIKSLLPADDEKARVIIFIDDLDRCNPKAAVRLLEGLKIYLSVPNCIFVLGMNERVLVDAIREELSADKDTTRDEMRLRAAHYLEKICTDIYRLPLTSSPINLLTKWLQNKEQSQALTLALGNLKCLPPNPRRLKALANQWSRFANCSAFPEIGSVVEPAQIQAIVSAQNTWAVRTLVVAYIHQFHRDLWERWHFESDFWDKIKAWCIEEDTSAYDPKKMPWIGSLKLTHSVLSGDSNSGASGSASTFPNPGDIENFWIGSLILRYKNQLVSRDFEQYLGMSSGAQQ